MLRREFLWGAAALLAAPVFAKFAWAQTTSAPRPAGKRVRVEGELVDTWCNVTGIMFASGTAHHKCAIWCALGGIPVSIRDKAGHVYMVLRLEEDEALAGSEKLARIQTHQVTVDGDLIERDGVNYLLVSKVADDKGIINLTQDEYGIQPFGE